MNPKPFVQNNYNTASLQLERLVVLLVPVILRFKFCNIHVEACMAERLTPRTPDLEARGSNLARRVVSLDKELYSTMSLFTHCLPGPKRLIAISTGRSGTLQRISSRQTNCIIHWIEIYPMGIVIHLSNN